MFSISYRSLNKTFFSPNVSLQVRLGVVTAELESLRKRRDEELASSFGEKAVLRDTANRLNIEIRRAQEELRAAQKRDYTAEKTKAELQQVNISLLAF